MCFKTSRTQTTGTKHNSACEMSFGRPSTHNNCPRCQELKAGATTRKGWFENKREVVNQSLSAYCFSVAIYHARCTKETNPSCACGKMSYTD
jgi:hypothetical protein